MRKALCGVMLLALAAAPAQAAVTVLGGGLAHACYVAAAGGRTSLGDEDLCSNALEAEMMSRRDHAATLVNRGILKLRRKAFADAFSDFDGAVAFDPKLAEAYVNRAAAQLGQRHYQEGLDDTNKALALGVGEPEKAYFNRAVAYEGLNDLKSAYFDYQKALELKPDWDLPQHELQRFTVERR